jgi:tetrahydromethanopterin S-methyltransferase subunit F
LELLVLGGVGVLNVHEDLGGEAGDGGEGQPGAAVQSVADGKGVGVVQTDDCRRRVTGYVGKVRYECLCFGRNRVLDVSEVLGREAEGKGGLLYGLSSAERALDCSEQSLQKHKTRTAVGTSLLKT